MCTYRKRASLLGINKACQEVSFVEELAPQKGDQGWQKINK